MSKLREIKSRLEHYYINADGSMEGECKYWYNDGLLSRHYFFTNGKKVGEYKIWGANGVILEHHFCCDGVDITPEVSASVDDIKVLTPEDRLFIKLKFGIKCLPESGK